MKSYWWYALIICFALSSCRQEQRFEIKGLAQGSYYSIAYYDYRNQDIENGIDSIFDAIDQSISLWNPNSIISRINRNDSSVVLDSIFIDNFNIAQQAAVLSDGLFDVTISPLVAAWGFSYQTNDILSDHLIDSLKQYVDYRKVRIVNKQLQKDNPNIKLDFNAVAQGYTSDLIGSYLESKNIENYIVDVGGEVLAKGKKPGQTDWIVGIEKPSADMYSEMIIQTKVRLVNSGLVTSGSCRKYIEKDGRRYSHNINAKTGRPIEHNLLSVSVISSTSVWADALASIFMISGMEKSLQLLEQMPEVEAYFIFWDNASQNYGTYATEGFQKLLID